jgi:hypothetical protein
LQIRRILPLAVGFACVANAGPSSPARLRSVRVARDRGKLGGETVRSRDEHTKRYVRKERAIASKK